MTKKNQYNEYYLKKAKLAYELYKANLPFKKVYTAVKKDDKYVVLKNSEGTKWKYQLAGGGVDQGESNENAIKREALEELNINVEVVKSLGILEYFCTWHYEDKSFDVKYVAEIFLTKFLSYGTNNKFGLDGEFQDNIISVAEISKHEMINNVSEFADGIKF